MRLDGGAENAAQRLELRWKSARNDLQEQEVPIGVLEAVDPLVEGGGDLDPAIGAVELDQDYRAAAVSIDDARWRLAAIASS